ncbi:hypothetical protein SISSUDRAFT_140431 [Sistotremastrum suecicum HHB10207 ss-3]|uniref:Arrestin-like N-terminal domain-containing protein n=1 Tax=Sistotremastrum suecicum HHB10207 ss-3 TaxID=1314776 RepID=A0A166GTA1_9AGAM|nr:hypothetical protein SISSUDRAFT_140431 [Sistotremastrum suecicum HHB10207 ss-3]
MISTMSRGVPPPPNYFDIPDLPLYTPATESTSQLLPPPWDRTQSRETCSNSNSNTEYIYTSQDITLNLGPRVWPTHAAAYPLGGVVEGVIELPNLKFVTRVDVKLVGVQTNCLTDRGLAIGQTQREVANVSQNLFTATRDTESPSQQPRFEFSIPIPQYIQGGMEPLPPSFFAFHPRLTSEIKYVIKVDVSKKGLRRHSRFVLPTVSQLISEFGYSLKSVIYYLPATFSPSPQFPVPIDAPRIPLPINSKGETDVTSDLQLPHPKRYPSSASIPFTLTLTCPSSPIVTRLLLQNINIELIRKVVLNVGGNRSTRETMMGRGEVWAVDEQTEGKFIIHGSVQNNKKESESSWHVPNAIHVQYAIKVTISQSRELSGTLPLPSIRHEEPIVLTTHDTQQNTGEPFPVIGMLQSVRGTNQLGIGDNSPQLRI